MKQNLLFPEMHVAPSIQIKLKRDDVHKGSTAETIAMLKLELADIHCLPSAQGRKYDFVAELNDGEFFRVQVKGTSQTKERYNFNFRRGFHGSKDGMFDYSPTDFDISCCVSLTDEAALFSAGVERSISWTRAQFNQLRAAILSFEEAVDEVRRKRSEAGI